MESVLGAYEQVAGGVVQIYTGLRLDKAYTGLGLDKVTPTQVTDALKYLKLQPVEERNEHYELKGFIVFLLGLSGYVGIKQYFSWRRRKMLNKKREKRRQDAQENILRIKKLRASDMSSTQVELITSMSFNELKEALNTGSFKPSQILHAYQLKAINAHDSLNCVVEFIDQAERWALELEKSGDKSKPLYGIPISIKEDIPIEGSDSTLGLASRIDILAEKDALLIKLFKEQGAVPFVRTNLSQFRMGYNGDNPIYGITKNSQDTKRTPGGSSAGEGALIGYGGSVLGIGSDIAGSIRVPSHYNGVFGFKPTSRRISPSGMVIHDADKYFQTIINGTFGPLSRNIEGIIAAAEVILDGNKVSQQDSTIAPIAFNHKMLHERRKLKIGYYVDNGKLTCTTAVRRAVEEAKIHLEKLGHELVEYRPVGIENAVKMFLSCLMCDGGESLYENIKDDEVCPHLKMLFKFVRIPYMIRRILSFLLDLKDPEENMLKVLTGGGLRNYWKLGAAVQAYRQEVGAEITELGLDALICPVFAFPAPPNGRDDVNGVSGGYTVLYNVLDYPAGVVPYTRVTPSDVKQMKDYPTHDKLHTNVKQLMSNDSTVGLPVGVQVVSAAYNDEMVLNVMKQLQAGANINKK